MFIKFETFGFKINIYNEEDVAMTVHCDSVMYERYPFKGDADLDRVLDMHYKENNLAYLFRPNYSVPFPIEGLYVHTRLRENRKVYLVLPYVYVYELDDDAMVVGRIEVSNPTEFDFLLDKRIALKKN